MPPKPLPGPQNFPPPTDVGSYSTMLMSASPPRQANAQQFEQPPPQPQPASPPPPPPQQPASPQPPVQTTATLSQQPVQVHVHTGEEDEDKQKENMTKKQQVDEAKEKLEEAIQGSQEVLVTAHTAVPFFSDTFTLDRAKVTFSKQQGVRSAEVMSMRVEDVLNCTADLGMVFGTLKVTNRIANAQPVSIGPFWRSDAVRLKRVTQGYVIAIQKEIDVSPLSTSELVSMLSKLGEDDHPSANTGEPTG